MEAFVRKTGKDTGCFLAVWSPKVGLHGGDQKCGHAVSGSATIETTTLLDLQHEMRSEVPNGLAAGSDHIVSRPHRSLPVVTPISMSQLLLEGWCMLSEACEECGTPLMRRPQSTEVICVNRCRTRTSEAAAPTSSQPNGLPNGHYAFSDEEAGDEGLDVGPPPPSLREQLLHEMQQGGSENSQQPSGPSSDEISQAIGERLLQRWALLGEHCPRCESWGWGAAIGWGGAMYMVCTHAYMHQFHRQSSARGSAFYLLQVIKKPCPHNAFILPSTLRQVALPMLVALPQASVYSCWCAPPPFFVAVLHTPDVFLLLCSNALNASRCSTPLMRDRAGQIFCVACNLPVKYEEELLRQEPRHQAQQQTSSPEAAVAAGAAAMAAAGPARGTAPPQSTLRASMPSNTGAASAAGAAATAADTRAMAQRAASRGPRQASPAAPLFVINPPDHPAAAGGPQAASSTSGAGEADALHILDEAQTAVLVRIQQASGNYVVGKHFSARGRMGRELWILPVLQHIISSITDTN